MASANVTLPGSSAYGFECDSTQRTATLNGRGGYVYNNGAADAYVNTDGGTVATSDPLGGGGMVVPVGKSAPLPRTCASFTFKSGSQTFLTYTQN